MRIRVLGMVAWLSGFLVQAEYVDSVLTTRLFEPHSLVAAPSGFASLYYLTDAGNHRVIAFSPASGVVNTLAGLAGQPGFSDGAGKFARFFYPQGLILLSDGLLVADTGNHLIRRVTFEGIVSTLAGVPGVPGNTDGPAAQARFNSPIGLALDATGNLYIADSKNHAVRRLDPVGLVTTVATGFNTPNAVAVDSQQRVIVADTRNHAIKRIEADGSIALLAGANWPGGLGSDDADEALEARLNNPRGLLWLPEQQWLLIADTGNHTVRRLIPSAESLSGYALLTYAGRADAPGLANGEALAAQFNGPIGLGIDPTQATATLVVDSGNHALRQIQVAPPQPPVPAPRIGKVTFVRPEPSSPPLSMLVPVVDEVFPNLVPLAILAGATGAQEYVLHGNTTNLTGLEPNPVGKNPKVSRYRDGLTEDELRSLFGADLNRSIAADWGISAIPDLTVKAISTLSGRRPSPLAVARFRFVTADPVIDGLNPIAFSVRSATKDAVLWYSTNGVPPAAGAPNSFRVSNNSDLSFNTEGERLVFSILAVAENFASSAVVTRVFTNAVPNRITLGFGDGEASSRFIGYAGQRYCAPVTLALVPGQKIYSLQFGLAVSEGAGSPPLAYASQTDMGFASMLMYPVSGGLLVDHRGATYDPVLPILNHPLAGIIGDTTFTNLASLPGGTNLLGVAWLERLGGEGIYPSLNQDLVTFSMARNRLYLGSEGKVVLGAFAFQIPASATTDDQYQVEIVRPSATQDGVDRPAVLSAPAAPVPSPYGLLSARHQVRIAAPGESRYLVGDVEPFTWLNVGEFGDQRLRNEDVLQVFQIAVYANNPLPRGSDYYDALDASNGATNALLVAPNGEDTVINSIAFGDGQLNVDDVYVTFRRSLDASLTNYARFWSNGTLAAVVWPHDVFAGPRLARPHATRVQLHSAPSTLPTSEAPSVVLAAGELKGAGGKVVAVPLQAKVQGQFALRVLMFNLTVRPVRTAPPLVHPLEFVPGYALGPPTAAAARGPANYAAAWLDARALGIPGAGLVGTLLVTLPDGAPPDSVYRVDFGHFSASPNGLALFPTKTQVGGLDPQLAAEVSTPGDGIPDAWRTRYFGSLDHPLAAVDADPDGDGIPNLAEFQAGTDPVELRLAARALDGLHPAYGVALRWFGPPGQQYVVESAPDAAMGPWLPSSDTLPSDGQVVQFDVTDLDRECQFFRVRRVP